MKNKNQKITFTILLLTFLVSAGLFAQGRPYEGPEDPAGDLAAEREGFMTGNRVFLYFRNTTELSDWPRRDVSKWPNNYQGVKMLDGVALMIGARVYLENDTIPVTDPAIYQSRTDLDTLYFLETSYREFNESDPTGTIKWKMYPVFGYFNVNSEYPAMSDRPESWPSVWPARGMSTKWPGEWNGRFGRGVTYADMETFFVVNDAQDQEYLGEDDTVKYYPRPGKYIGDLRHDVSIQYGKPWGGTGLRIETRGFQWNNPQSRDAIFWEYNISNISDYTLPEVGFGYWVDNQIGLDSDDEIGFFDTKVDMAYSWDIDGIGLGGLPTGIMGFAFLESPGLPFDGIDNDEDGIIDEKRDNTATAKVGPLDGITDLSRFLDFYNLKEADLHDHWDADEDQDWQDGIDANNDGIYQVTEFAGDDVGLDGVSPGDINYTGPDDGECNHKPDFIEGLGCEPNFAATDVSESDMLGLVAFRMLPSHNRRPFHWQNDKEMFDLVASNYLKEYYETPSNLIETFGSGPFPLYKGRTERISMAILHAYDALSGLNSADHSAPSLFRKKEVVQIIYESDYRFAQPPEMPTLKATAGDGKVYLSWDRAADLLTRDPFVENINDFEGYKLYRATDKKMSDAEIITDGFGTPMYLKPIFQCDLDDNINDFIWYPGMDAAYYLGDDKGISHHFIDNTVQNGRTYYYALVAYDYGAPNIGQGVSPSENKIIIELDEAENVRKISKNVAIVTPHQTAAGFISPEIELLNENEVARFCNLRPEIFDIKRVKPDHVYKVKFQTNEVDHAMMRKYRHPYDATFVNDTLSVYDMTEGDTLIYRETYEDYPEKHLTYNGFYWHFSIGRELETEVIDGVQLKFEFPIVEAEYDSINSGWLVGDSPLRVTPSLEQSLNFPWNYEIVFTDDENATVGRTDRFKAMYNQFEEGIKSDEVILGHSFNFYVVNKSIPDSAGNYEKLDLMVYDVNKNEQFDLDEDYILAGFTTYVENQRYTRWVGTVLAIDFFDVADESQMPKTNDVYRVKFKRPFHAIDSLMYKIKPDIKVDESLLTSTLEKVKVVPNPYIATNTMEPAVSNIKLNQRRRLMFTHLPAQCTINIFTMSGELVDTIEVDNMDDDGIVHWDLLSREGLEVAAGMYIYHLKVHVTGGEKMGKFAVIK
ncbi:hypothetical protein H8E88_11845 [candidate division KSB1 bacterium]|nr:hypothetical protein [candidate division KSB1 bacterium]